MPSVTLSVWDVALPGRRVPAGTVVLADSACSLRELIRGRVLQEVARRNAAPGERFVPLVEPEETEILLNRGRERQLDGEAQFVRACAAFERNGFLVLIDGKQVTSLEKRVELRPDSQVEFVKLVPLVGGRQ